MARLLIAHLQAGDAPESISACVEAIEPRSDLAVFCWELINHAPITSRTISVLAKVLATALPAHPLAAMASSEALWAAPAYDATKAEGGVRLMAPLSSGFPASFEGLLCSTELPLDTWAHVKTLDRQGDLVRLAVDPDSALLADGFNIAPPCILVVSQSTKPAPRWSSLIAKARRGWLRLNKA